MSGIGTKRTLFEAAEKLLLPEMWTLTRCSVPMADVALGAAVGLLFGRVLPTLEQRQGAKAD